MKSSRTDFLLLAAGLLALWQLVHWAVGPDVLASPWATIARAAGLMRTSAFWDHAGATAVAFAVAAFISIVGGIALGLWLGLRRFAGDVADPILGTLYSIPKITLYPIILLIFGLGVSAKIAFGVIHGVFPIAIFTMNAVRNVAPVYHRTARVMRLTLLGAALTIMAPAALPEILAGIRVGVALTLLGVLIGELFAATAGLGFALRRAMDIHAVTDIMAIALLLFVFAAGANALLRIVERRARHGG
ncbi:MAG TPA: ABC transporter permease subunit [Xanthobacteraceae bacterium]|nr:ABC transporter permease subunit [Xanthobacteraceae bacterium]